MLEIIMNWLSKLTRRNKALPLSPNLLRQKLLTDPYYRLTNLTEVALAAELGLKIDVNQASVDDWLRLPGISIHQARLLVELAQTGVQFLCLEDLAAALSLSIARLKPLEPILDFYYYHPASLSTPQRLNPNTASVEQLASIPALNRPLAERIVANRQQNGTYSNLIDLQRRLALDGEIISQLMYYLSF